MADTVIRIKREEGYTVLPNALLRDRRLSLKTKGLFCMMLSFPGDWSYSVGGLVSVCGAGRDAIRSALRDLEAAGYLEREKVHGERGRFSGTVYTLHTVSKTPWTENPPTVEPGEADSPLTDYPATADPTADNPPLQNKDYINTPYSPPEGDAVLPHGQDRDSGARVNPPRSPVTADSIVTGQADPAAQGSEVSKMPVRQDLFDQFWAAYPRKQAKEKAWRAWKKLDPDEALCRQMAEALDRHRRSQQWQRDGGAYIPYPATWINGRRWEDEPDAPASAEAPMLPEEGRWI